jgi:hypothetical protein
MAAPAQYEAAIFFENDKSQRLNVSILCPHNMQIVEINETYDPPELKFDNDPLQSYIESLGTNHYVNMLHWGAIEKDAYDPVSGIQETHMEAGRRWLAETAGKRRAALFDWDRTITVVEGFVSTKDASPYIDWGITNGLFTRDQYLEDMLTYLCGGTARITALRIFISELVSAGVNMYVLTNNTGCGNDTYTEIVSAFFDEVQHTIICGKDYRFNKGIALVKTSGFVGNICREMPWLRGGARRSIILDPDDEAALLMYILNYYDCDKECWEKIGKIIDKINIKISKTVFRGQGGSSIRTDSPFFSTTPIKEMAELFSPVNWNTEPPKKLCCLMIINLINVPVLSTRSINFQYSKEVETEYNKYSTERLWNKEKIIELIEEMVFTDEAENGEEIIVKNGGSFFKEAELKDIGFNKLNDTTYETWYTIKNENARKNLTRRRRGAAARRQTWKSRTLGRRGARRAARSNRR